jgi:cytochrome c-type biogenesis protein CcmH
MGPSLVGLRPFSSRVVIALLLAFGIAVPGGFGVSASALAAAPRASLTQLEDQLMCVACHESLAVAQAPESFSERQYVRDLIAQGETAEQIKRNMVAQYGPSVLAVPPAHGFNLLVYVLPPVLVALGIVTIALTIPKWRRRARQVTPIPSAAPLSPDDARRLKDDLGRYA